jgi:hypothetical protein
MRKRVALILVTALMWATPAVADDQLIGVKTLGKAVDDMSANMSKAESDSDSEILARVTRQALENGLKEDRPTIDITASAGYCKVSISTPQWDLWSEARGGKIINHGAKIH